MNWGQLEREEDALGEALADGRISQAEYNAEMRELQRDVRAAYEQDRADAIARVRDEYGGW